MYNEAVSDEEAVTFALLYGCEFGVVESMVKNGEDIHTCEGRCSVSGAYWQAAAFTQALAARRWLRWRGERVLSAAKAL